jgi:2-methylcitrate dehydratase PrpD
MAMALLRGRMTLHEYENAPWETAEVKNAMEKIDLVLDPERDRAFDTEGILGVRLVAELNNGRTEEIIVHQPRGHPDAPLSDADLLEKMTWLLQAPPPTLEPQRLLNLCNRLSTVEDIAELIDCCRIEQP